MKQELAPSSPFARDYAQAREKFLQAGACESLDIETYENPATGPHGERLYTDVVQLGSESAPNVLLLNSATHGVEGFCGAGSLTGWLHTHPAQTLPRNVRVVAIHAINPYGFAWLRRVTEDNVDLNRNFIDHVAPRPENADYTALHPHLLPAQWSPETAANTETALEAFAREHGAFAMQAALSRGQYTHPDGLFYGGDRPGWSNRTFRTVLERHVRGAAHVGFLDFHTGLGPFGHGELISKCALDDPEYRRLHEWYGPAVKTSAAGESNSPMLSGLIATAVRDIMPANGVSALTVEYGTYPFSDVLRAIRADNWLHARGDRSSARAQEINAYVRERFYPDDPDWRELVLVRSKQLIHRALAGLAGL